MVNLSQYPFEIHPLEKEDGGGFLITFPDFSECISDGETQEEAIRNGLDALHETIVALESAGHSVPKPGSSRDKFIQLLPKSLSTRLIARAKQEGISINAFVTALIADPGGVAASGVGERNSPYVKHLMSWIQMK